MKQADHKRDNQLGIFGGPSLSTMATPVTRDRKNFISSGVHLRQLPSADREGSVVQHHTVLYIKQ